LFAKTESDRILDVARRRNERFFLFERPTSNTERPASKWVALSLLLTLALSSQAFARAKIPTLSSDPYLGAVVLDGTTGAVIFDDNANGKGYPASMIKLMDLLIVFESIEKGALRLTDKVRVTADAARMGGSQVYLKENEVFTVDELLYALIIQSANDAAVALAVHIAGSKQAFVGIMNRRAMQLGMRSTVFQSVHGLPPGTGQQPDISTARDMAVLSRHLALRHPAALRYTSTTLRGFRNNTFEMRTHNRLLGVVQGCDGLKTGYFRAGGFSIAATAERHGRRIFTVVLGSRDRTVREAKAQELLAHGFLNLPPETPPQPVEVEPEEAPEEEQPEGSKLRRWPRRLGIGLLVVAGLFAVTRLVARHRLGRYDGLR